MDSSLWMPLSVSDDMNLRPDPIEWTSGLCATPTGQRIQDFFCIFCCSLCAFSEECVNIKPYYGMGPVPENYCDTYFSCCACCIFMSFVTAQIPCCAFCCIRCRYREKRNIKGSDCGDCLATFVCCCCAHVQVDLSTAAARSPAAPAARPFITSVPLTHATTHRLWTT